MQFECLRQCPVRILLTLIGVVAIFVCGCDSSGSANRPPKELPLVSDFELTMLENGEPSHVTVQHILIGFTGSIQGKKIARTREEARTLAAEVLEQARSGADFDKLVVEYTDDSPPGIYKIANLDQPFETRGEDRSRWTRQRSGLVPAFGNVGFKLQVDEVAMADYNRLSSPYGWHIIKRLK